MIASKVVKELAEGLNIKVRVTTAESLDEAKTKFKKQQERGLFLHSRGLSDKIITDEFFNPATLLPEARSIISSFLFYLTSDEPDPSIPGNPFGLVARYTQRNYYKELKKRLKKFARILKKEYGGKFIVHCCGPIAEKPIASKSGIGYYGKHGIVINPSYGSWIVLGEVITSLELEPDEPLNINCGKCEECIEACPTRAIIEPYVIDRSRCIQSLANYSGIIPEDIARVWSNRLYGCTTCQEVCPVNKRVKPEPPGTEIGIVGAYVPLIDILKMDETTYRSKYANNQMSARWINFNAIKRNALLALGNIKDKKTIPVIKKFINDDDKIIHQAAIWALGQF